MLLENEPLAFVGQKFTRIRNKWQEGGHKCQVEQNSHWTFFSFPWLDLLSFDAVTINNAVNLRRETHFLILIVMASSWSVFRISTNISSADIRSYLSQNESIQRKHRWYKHILARIWFYCDWIWIRYQFSLVNFNQMNINVHFSFSKKLGGSVVANRLSEIPEFSVLLLEAGGEENFISDVPLTPSITTLTSNATDIFK